MKGGISIIKMVDEPLTSWVRGELPVATYLDGKWVLLAEQGMYLTLSATATLNCTVLTMALQLHLKQYLSNCTSKLDAKEG